MIDIKEVNIAKVDISLGDLDRLQTTLTAYEQVLAHATRNWKLMTRQEKLKFIEAFDTIVKLSEGFQG